MSMLVFLHWEEELSTDKVSVLSKEAAEQTPQTSKYLCSLYFLGVKSVIPATERLTEGNKGNKG